MKKKDFKNYLDMLISVNGCVDRVSMEKYIACTTDYRWELINKQIDDVDSVIKSRFERFGVITEEDYLEAFKKGYDILCKISVTLEDVRKMIQDFGFEENSPIGIRIRQDWNYVVHLLQDYLLLENNNLINYNL